MSAELVDFKMNENDKSKALDAAIGQIEKAFGKGSVMKLGQRDSVVDIQAVSSSISTRGHHPGIERSAVSA